MDPSLVDEKTKTPLCVLFELLQDTRHESKYIKFYYLYMDYDSCNIIYKAGKNVFSVMHIYQMLLHVSFFNDMRPKDVPKGSYTC